MTGADPGDVTVSRTTTARIVRPRPIDRLAIGGVDVIRPGRSALKAAIRTVLGIAAIGCVALPARLSAQDFNAKDAQILGRTLGYSGDGLTGLVMVGVLFAPGNPASRLEAERIQSVIGDELPTGRIRLHTRLIAVDRLTREAKLNALYITEGLAGDREAIADAARRLHAPTISMDLDCVTSGACVVGFSSEPTVQILLNQGAAEHIGVHFLQAFRMLVREK